MICDINTFFEIQDCGQKLCTASNSRFQFENVGNRAKTDIVTPTSLNARDLSKMIWLYFMS